MLRAVESLEVAGGLLVIRDIFVFDVWAAAGVLFFSH